jgi:carboxylesterase type B
MAIVLCYSGLFSAWKHRKSVALYVDATGHEALLGSDKILGDTAAPCKFEFIVHCFICVGTVKCFLVGAFLMYFSLTHGAYLGRVIGGEDCLFLNVYAHENALAPHAAALPVVVFVHGGDLTTGAGTDEGPAGFYGGSWALAAEGRALAVQFNYRLSALGFLYLEDKDGQSVLGDSANLGLLDQIAALQWVRDNIRDFGGDPNRVTVYGQSSGGTSIAGLLASPLAKGLFHRAFMMSASPRIDATLQQAALSWRRYFLPAFPHCIREWDADYLRHCLYSLTAEEIVHFMPVQYSDPDWENSLPVSANSDGPVLYMAVADGRVILGNISDVFSHDEPSLPNVPAVFGNVREESDLDLKQVGEQSVFDNAAWPFSEEQAVQWGVQLTGDMSFGEKVWRLYKPPADVPVPKNPDDVSSPLRQKWSQLTSDMRSICGNIHNAGQLSKGQQAPVYSYLFTHRPQSPVVSHLQGWPAWVASDKSQYAFHMWDIILLFNRTAGYSAGDSYVFTPLDFAVSGRFRSDFLEFAETGHINAWKTVKPGTSAVCQFGEETSCNAHTKQEECKLFREYNVAYANWIVN